MMSKFLVFNGSNVSPIPLSEDDFSSDGKLKEDVVMSHYNKHKDELESLWKEGWECDNSDYEYTVNDDCLVRVQNLSASEVISYSVVDESEL